MHVKDKVILQDDGILWFNILQKINFYLGYNIFYYQLNFKITKKYIFELQN